MNLIADQQKEDGVEAGADCPLQGIKKEVLRFNATIK